MIRYERRGDRDSGNWFIKQIHEQKLIGIHLVQQLVDKKEQRKEQH